MESWSRNVPIRSVRQFFRYLHEGKLFEFEGRAFDGHVPGSTGLKRHQISREIECFWLCASCALT